MKVSTTLAAGLAWATMLLMAPATFAQQAPTPTTETAPTDATDELDIDIADAEPAPPEAPADATANNEATQPVRDPSAADPAPADPSLLPVYREFGEMAGLSALMDDFMVILLADPRTRPFFENADRAAVKKHLAEQFCVILGGPCSYTGRDMKTVHAGLGIERSHFNALVEDLQIAMDKRGISFRSQNKLLAKLAPMHREVETQ